ncbi:MAG: hypothetical protein WAK67_06275 [Xanthobacteraceae bacterium]
MTAMIGIRRVLFLVFFIAARINPHVSPLASKSARLHAASARWGAVISMLFSQSERCVVFATCKWESSSRYRMLCDEAKQFSVDRRMNQMKTPFCDAIKCHSQNLVAP